MAVRGKVYLLQPPFTYAAVGIFMKSVARFTIILFFYFKGPQAGTKAGPVPKLTGKPSPIQPKSTPKAIGKFITHRIYGKA